VLETEGQIDQIVQTLSEAGPELASEAIQQYRVSLLPLVPGWDRIRGLEYDNPQTLAFATDAMPALISLIRSYPKKREIKFLDIGPGFGGASGLISEMFCSDFLWTKVHVDALDIRDTRRDYFKVAYPLVNFAVGDITQAPKDARWDIVYCSNVIEHTSDPKKFLRDVMEHCDGYAVFLAPYNELENRSPAHFSIITEETFSEQNVVSFSLIDSLGWKNRKQALVVLRSYQAG